ncbi:MAG: hypothetical protein KBA90_14765 [Chitinophagaceae bacterium]|nr:hypothetical protein [Chitinophagaceae bacterium]
MAGIRTDLKNLGQSFEKLKAMQGEDERKRAMLKEFKFAFERQGYSPWMATNLAEEKYKQLHK